MTGKERKLRLMEPRDMPAVWRICRAQNRRDGTNYPVPPVFDVDEASPRHGQLLPNVVLALVTEVDGRVRQWHLWLRTIEEMNGGGGREDTVFSIGHMPMVKERLRALGYQDMHVLVPRTRVDDLEQMLNEQELRRIDHRFAHFFTNL